GTGIALTGVGTPAHGTAVIQSGEVLYTADASFAGSDSFSYTITGGTGLTATAGVTLTVFAPPNAIAQSGTVRQGQSLLIDVLAGDTGSGITLTGVGTPSHGTTVIQSGEVLYTAAGNYEGADSFSYTITGATGLTATASVTMTVTEPPPVANTASGTVVA